MKLRLSQKSAAVGIWIVSGVLLVAGYAGIELREGGRLAEAESRAQTLAARIVRAEGVVRDRVRLREARRHIVDDIRAQEAYGRGAELAPMLVALDRAARRSGIAVVSVEPQSASPDPSTDRWLIARTVKIVVRGEFAHFMTFLPVLSIEDPLLQMRDVAISAAQRGRSNTLVFTVGASAFAVSAAGTKE